MKISKAVEAAYKAALKTRNHSHSPYSRFKVGAAVQLKGKPAAITGCNVENASYGATICAERNAIFAAVAAHGKIKPEFLVVVTGEAEATVPCALCLQVLAEFAGDTGRLIAHPVVADQEPVLVGQAFHEIAAMTVEVTAHGREGDVNDLRFLSRASQLP